MAFEEIQELDDAVFPRIFGFGEAAPGRGDGNGLAGDAAFVQQRRKNGTKSAKRLLRKRAGREARFAADTNHRISKKLVTEAEGTCRKPQRVTLHSWGFQQLGSHIAYKAARAGVPVVFVDPRYTSQGCSACGHLARKNRPDQATLRCTSCGFAEHTDINAARNIAARWPFRAEKLT